MTRPPAASERFLAQLLPHLPVDVEAIVSPLLEIRPLGGTLDLKGFGGVIFTSSNGVGVVAGLTTERTCPAFCVGPATTEAARRDGWSAVMVGETAEDLISALLSRRPKVRLLHLRGEHGRGDVAENLTRSGLPTDEQVIYRQELIGFSDAARAAMADDRPVLAPIFSPRTARQFADQWEGSAPLWIAAISEAAAKPMKSLNFQRLIVSDQPNADGMCAAIKNLVNYRMRVESIGDAD